MKPKIIFVTKSLCYHQVGIADKLYSAFKDDFAFIQMREPLEFRVKNKQEGFERPYLFGYSKDEQSNKICHDIIKNAQVIIWGEASLKVLKNIKKNAVILKYSERIFKRGYYKTNILHFFLNCLNLLRLKFFLRNKNAYLLSAGEYSSKDYNRFGIFKNKSLRWGYFPELKKDDNDKRINGNTLSIIWVNRLIKWKHPEYAIEAAKILESKSIDYSLNIVGDGDLKSGEMKKKIKKMIVRYNLSKHVHMLGKIEPQKVLELYKESDVALFTSGPAEGWGVGLSEAMNYGCVSIASDKMGSTLYLLNDKNNGFVYRYRNKKSFRKVLLEVVENRSIFEKVGKNAKETIDGLWNCNEASSRLINIIIQLLDSGAITNFPEEGPCSLIR